MECYLKATQLLDFNHPSLLNLRFCSEYDLKSLRVRRLRSGRNSFDGTIVRLEPDVAEMFPSADAVNEALRFLVRVTQENQIPTPKPQPNQF
jgi:hypothetical protein